MKKIKYLLTIGLLCATSQVVYGQNLRGALVVTYKTNPSLDVARSAVKQAESDLALSKSGFLPVISADGSSKLDKIGKDSKFTTTNALQLSITENLFNGFQTLDSVNIAKANLMAQRASLANEEQNQLNNAVAAYVNVYATREIVTLRKNNLAALEEQERAAKARLDVGEGTKTDYAQAEAAHSRAISELAEAVAANSQAEAIYYEIIGQVPAGLARPEMCKDIPSSFKQAVNLALQKHPALIGANYAVKAAEYAVEMKKHDYLPKINAGASIGVNNVYYDGKKISDSSRSGPFESVKIGFSMPIYQAGTRGSAYQKAKEQLNQSRLQLLKYTNNVRTSLIAAWAKLESSRSSVAAYLSSVKAAKIALDGRVQENKVGQATFLDVLNTRSQLIDMQIALINAKKNLVIASYNVKSAIGCMTADSLHLNAIVSRETKPVQKFRKAKIINGKKVASAGKKTIVIIDRKPAAHKKSRTITIVK